MERRFPLVPMDAALAETLLAALPGSPRLRCFTLLAGGHINTNYALELSDGRCVVLRIYAQGNAAFRKETALLEGLAGLVAVPAVLATAYEPRDFAYPYALLEWIDGTPLNEVLAAEPAAAVGEAVAEALLGIGRQAIPAEPFPPFADYIGDCLFRRGAAGWLGPEATERLWRLVLQQAPRLEKLHRTDVLVHGDFQGDNILLEKAGQGWRVAAVIDWEWAHKGCYLQDLGSLFRLEGVGLGEFQAGLEAGFARQGGALPPAWQKAARLWDVAALCEKLAYPRHRGEVTKRSIRLIEGCMADFAR
ncbi:MAG TPA: aminoglycoside phosphotransferase family protein [Dongiaceae bacterium]